MTTTLRETKTGWSARIRMGAGQRPWLPMPPMKATEAEDRRERLQRLAMEFVRAGKAADTERSLRLCAEQPTMKAFEVAERAARRLLTEAVDTKPEAPRTFRDVAELWLSGELHRRYPEEVPSKIDEGHKADRAILSVFFPLLGPKLMTEMTPEHVDEAKCLVPTGLAPSTRTVYLVRLRTVLKFAVEPLHLIAHSPARGNLVPKRNKRASRTRDYLFIYPSEELQLVSCIEIPFEFRLLYGYLCRNGTRISETLHLTWAHIDFERGTVRVEKGWTKGKTHGRVWKLCPDVLAALHRRWVEEGKPKSGLVFHAPDGSPLTRKIVRDRFTQHLIDAGIERKELIKSTADTRHLVLHDCRSSFITLARKLGRRMVAGEEIVMNDRWIMDRTGHIESATLTKYDRLVRDATQLSLGWFAPLDEALWPSTKLARPVTRRAQPGPSMDQRRINTGKNRAKDSRTWTAECFSAPTEQPNSAAAARSNGTERPLGPPWEGGVDQRIGRGVTADVTSPAPAPVTARLTAPLLQELLELATRGKRWHLVTALADELEALSEAASGNVVQLDPRRRK